jgi:hypothetical protein
MGLLDMLGEDATPEQRAAAQRGLLTMGLAMMGTKGSFGQALSRGGLLGMQAMDDAQTQQRQQQLGNVQMQAQRLQLEQAQQAAERAKQLQSLPGQFFKSPAQQALAQGGGPTQANAQAMTGMKPEFDSEGYGRALMAIDPKAGLDWLNSTAKQDTSTVYNDQGQQVTIDRRTGRPVVTGSPKLPEAVQAYQFAQQQGYKGSFEDWTLAQKQAGAMQMVSMGSPVPMRLADGSTVMVQPANRPGAAPQIMRDPNTGAPMAPPDPRKTEPMSQAMQKELMETDDAIVAATGALDSLKKAEALSKDAYSGYGAKTRATLASNVPGFGSKSADATIQFDNIMTEQALSSMKAIFGAAPTEGERKILMDVQASVERTPAQREETLKQAQAAIQRRLAFNRAKADAIRSGDYLTKGVQPGGTTEPVKITGDADFARLPSGAQFIGPDGKLRRKP